MREAIGGSWILSIVVIFIFLFLFFLSYSINYTRAFNVKNEIINYIEHAEGYTTADINQVNLDDDDIKDTVQVKAYKLIRGTGYDYENVSISNCQKYYRNNNQVPPSNGQYFKEEGGYCVVKVCQDPDNSYQNTYYKVTTFITMKLPLFNLGINIPVSGQTRTIYKDTSNYPCDY